MQCVYKPTVVEDLSRKESKKEKNPKQTHYWVSFLYKTAQRCLQSIIYVIQYYPGMPVSEHVRQFEVKLIEKHGF